MSSAWTDESDFDDIIAEAVPTLRGNPSIAASEGPSRGRAKIPLTTVCMDKLADGLNLRVTSITKRLAANVLGKSPPPTFMENKSLSRTPYDVERLSPTSDFTLGSVDDPSIHQSFTAIASVNAHNRRSINDSPLSSIASGPELMFPAVDDGLGWIEIPKRDTQRSKETGESDPDDITSPLQPLLDREARLPPSAGALLGTATDAMSSWLQTTVPKLPSRTQMDIVQDASGAAYGTVKSTKATGTKRNLKRKLKLPKLPNEVKSVKMYQDPVTSQIFLSVILSRPLLAWVALFLAAVAECFQSYILMMELRKKTQNERSPLFRETDVSVTEIWVMEGLLLFMSMCCCGGWVLGEFAEKRTTEYLRSAYGIMHSMLLMVSFGVYTVPWTKHTAQTGWVSLLYAMPPVLMSCAKLFAEQKVPIRHLLGVALLIAAFGGGTKLPDGIHNDNWYTWITITMGCVGLATCVWSTKQLRPHLPLPFMVLLMALGGFMGQIPFAVDSRIDGEAARHDLQTLFFGWTNNTNVAPWMGLTALHGVTLAGWTWSIMYLSPLSIASALVAQRLVAMSALSLAHPHEDTPGVPARLLPLVPLFLGILVIWFSDYKDTERLIELQENQPRTPQSQARSFSHPAERGELIAHSLLSIHGGLSDAT